MRELARPREVRMAPKDWCAMSDQADCQDSAEPVDRAEPTESMDPTEPTLPIDATEPTLPIDNSDPREPIESTESVDHSDRRARRSVGMTG